MKKFEYDFILEENTEKEADSKVSSLAVLAKNLTAKELEKLAWIIKNDPVKTAMAKQALFKA